MTPRRGCDGINKDDYDGELLLMIMFSELHSEGEQRGQLGSQFEVQPRSSAFPDTQVAPRVS